MGGRAAGLIGSLAWDRDSSIPVPRWSSDPILDLKGFTVYRYVTNGTAVEHADHIWEGWNAYLSSDLPEHVSADETGICCHTCRVVVVGV